MDARIRKIVVLVAVAAVALVVVVAILRQRGDGAPTAPEGDSGRVPATTASGEDKIRAVDVGKASAEDSDTDSEAAETSSSDETEEPKTPEELQEEEEEKKVEAFDSLTDKWMEKEGGEVTMKDMDAFVAAFKAVPDSRKDECLHRALNLVSDDHVLLLAGILFDKSIDKEYLELVFNDVLNRDEEVKKLILPRIFKDKTHPCWADTAWILDVTGETPNKETNNE